jgi:hypothetical protein
VKVTAIAIFQGRTVTSPEFINPDAASGRILAGDLVLDVVRMDTGLSVAIANFSRAAPQDDMIIQEQGSLSGIMLLAYFGR